VGGPDLLPSGQGDLSEPQFPVFGEVAYCHRSSLLIWLPPAITVAGQAIRTPPGSGALGLAEAVARITVPVLDLYADGTISLSFEGARGLCRMPSR
jgi:hypothetical protein